MQEMDQQRLLLKAQQRLNMTQRRQQQGIGGGMGMPMSMKSVQSNEPHLSHEGRWRSSVMEAGSMPKPLLNSLDSDLAP